MFNKEFITTKEEMAELLAEFGLDHPEIINTLWDARPVQAPSTNLARILIQRHYKLIYETQEKWRINDELKRFSELN